ncbi:hypothetical protein BU23DRAFT_444255, partial [Bimuria novae-zelandiae CBS 107.79]
MPIYYGNSADVELRIQACLDDFSGVEKFNIAAAARDYCVPVTRLRARIKGRSSRHDRPGANQRLTKVQDDTLKLYIRRCDDLGMPCLMPQLTEWLTRWIERHPECRRIKQKPQDINRTAMATFEAYSQHFTRLKKVMYDHGITPTDTYNMDETGFRIGIG